jgi:hypothetical protein
MASLIRLVPKDESLAPLNISTGTGTGIWLGQGQDSLFPVPALAEAWSEGEAGEGSKRISYRPENSIASGSVYIAGDDDAGFRSYSAQWQTYVHSLNAFGGTVEYTPEEGEQITYEVRSMQITSMPQDGIWIRAFTGISEFTITFAPYGELEDISVFSGITSNLPVTGFEVGDRSYESVVLADEPSLYWRLGKEGASDTSGHARTGTGVGGINIGASVGALANDEDASTTFDGSNDKITSTYAPFTAGSVRTIEGWGYRASTGAIHTLFGGSLGTGPRLTLASGSQEVIWTANAAVSASWPGAWPGVNQWVHWAIIFDDPANSAELFINGVSQGVRAAEDTYTSPGNIQLGAYALAAFFNGKLDEFAVYEKRLSPERIFAHYLAGMYRVAVPGSAPALVKLTLTETQGTTRDHFEYGLDNNFDPLNATTLLIDAPPDVEVFAGVAASRPGAYSYAGTEINVIRATLYTVPVAICAFDTEAVGKSRIKARVFGGGSTATFVRLSWRIGEGDFTHNEWCKLPSTEAFWEIDLGVMNVPKAVVGTQGAEGRIEAYAAASGQTFDLDTLAVIPLAAYGKAKIEAISEQSASPVMYDDGTSHTVGALNGTLAPIGGAWTVTKLSTGEANITVNEAKEFTYSATNAEGPWKNAVAVTATPSALGPTVLSWDAKYTITSGNYVSYVGGVVRYVDQWNYILAALQRINVGGSSAHPYLMVVKARNGTTKYEAYTDESPGFAQPDTWWSYSIAVDTSGVWSFQAGARGTSLTTYLSGQDADLATGGKLATGQVGIAGNPISYTGGNTAAVYWDNIACFSLEASKHLINAKKDLELTSSALNKEPISGTVWNPETLDGGYPKLEPNRVSRLVVKTRATNVDTNQDAPTTNAPVNGNSASTASAAASAVGTTSAETAIAKPANTYTNSLLLGSLSYGSSATPHGISLIGFTAESLWTRIKTNYGLNTFYRTATEADPAIVAAATGTTNTALTVGVVNYIGADPGAPINVSAAASGTGTAVTAPSVTTTVPNALIIVAVGAVTTGGTTPSISVAPNSMVFETQLGKAGTGIRVYQAQYADKAPQLVPGASGTRAFTLDTSSEWVAHTIAIAPAKPLDGFSASLTITPRVQLVAN